LPGEIVDAAIALGLAEDRHDLTGRHGTGGDEVHHPRDIGGVPGRHAKDEAFGHGAFGSWREMRQARLRVALEASAGLRTPRSRTGNASRSLNGTAFAASAGTGTAVRPAHHAMN
jgi:hypothetical protein